MHWIRSSTSIVVSRGLLVAGMSLIGTMGCRPESEPSLENGGEAEAEVTDEAKSALQVATYDFLTNAPGAFWHNNDGGLAWGSNGNPGVCMTTSGVMENGVTYPSFLYTHPKLAANGFMHGAYTVAIPAAALHPTVTATFGFKQGASGTSGVKFSLTTQVNGTWVTIFSQTKTYTGALSTLTADLTPYAGQTIQLFLNVDAGSNSNYDWAGWTDVRVTADSSTTPTSCTIGGVGYAAGAVNPAISCQICEPDTSASAWTTRGDSCLIGSTCYSAGQTDALGCKVCDPNVNQGALTVKSACDNLVIGVTTNSMTGDMNGQTGADGICASQGNGLGLPGVWKALVSSNGSGGQNYKDRVPSGFATMPVVNLQGQQLYSDWNSIFTNQVWPAGISINQFGNATTPAGAAYAGDVWTGTNATGVWDDINEGLDPFPGRNCMNFTANVNALVDINEARIGDWANRKLVDGGWGSTSSRTYCTASKRLACVLVPPPGRVTVVNYDGTAEGIIQARSQGNAYAFLGVPYAAPPVGAYRLAPPQKVTAWSGVKNTFNQPQVCAQKGFFLSLPNGYIGSEDCLYLNVWTPKTAAPGSNLPVFVYFHPGGNMFGGTSAVDDVVGQKVFDGDRLASSQNMIVVTPQIRLAVLGYLASPELSADASSRTNPSGSTSGNYGLLDAIQALKWVKKNIYNFGGDPNLVTLAGQSGGATVSALLLSSPLAKDPADSNKPYFSRAMFMSGFYEEPNMQTRYNQAAAIMPSLKAGCTDNSTPVKCLRSAPLSNFVNAAGDFLMFIPNILNQYVSPDMAFGLPFGPSVDGYVVPNPPRTTFANGQHNKVPVIMGSTQKEFSSFMVTGVAGLLHAVQTLDITNMIYLPTCQSFNERAKLNLGDAMGSTLSSMYPCSGIVIGPTVAYSDAMTHAQYQCPLHRTAVTLSGAQTQSVRRYMFTHNADRIGVFQNLLKLVPQIGAAHALDAMYVFNTHETYVLGLRTYLGPSPRERDLTNRYQSFIRAFAQTGDPNNATLGTNWTAYNASQDNYLSLKVVNEGNNWGDPGPQMLAGADLKPGGGLSSGIGTSNCQTWDSFLTINATQACTPTCSGKVCGADGCGGTCGTCGSGLNCAPDQTACVAPGATATVSGFNTCSCLNGSFPLTKSGSIYSSTAITGCPGQTQPAYIKFNESSVALGITNQTSSPGSGNSDYSPGTVTSPSPYQASGNGSTAGNINSFCPGSEDLHMHWTVTK